MRRRTFELMDGKASLEQIAGKLAAEFPQRFSSWRQALSFAGASRKSSAAKIKKHKARECGRRSGVAFFLGSAFARTAILVCQAERTTQGVEQRVARGVAVGLPVLFGGRQRES